MAKTFDLVFNADEFQDHSEELMDLIWQVGRLAGVEIDGTNLFLKFQSEPCRMNMYKAARPIVKFLGIVTYVSEAEGADASKTSRKRTQRRMAAIKDQARQIIQATYTSLIHASDTP